MKNYSYLLLLALIFTACQPAPTAEQKTPPTVKEEEKTKPVSIAEQLAQQQLDAYNKRDIEAFLIPYSDSVKVYNNITEFGYQGKEKMREGYTNFFSKLDSLHCDVVNRIVTENTVIDHEKLYFGFPGQVQHSEAIAIYKIAHDKIQEVYFVNP